jgi:hypothetical protein
MEPTEYNTHILKLAKYKRLYNNNFIKRLEIMNRKYEMAPEVYTRKMKQYTKLCKKYDILIHAQSVFPPMNPFSLEIRKFVQSA